MAYYNITKKVSLSNLITTTSSKSSTPAVRPPLTKFSIS